MNKLNGYTLMLDASTKVLWLALALDEKILDATFEVLDRKQSEWMVPKIQDLLLKHEINFQKISSLIVGDGPGSFTGVRLALTFAKTLAHLLPIKLFVFSSLQMGAISPLAIVTGDARAERSYLGVFQNQESLVEPTIVFNHELPTIQARYPQSKTHSLLESFSLPYQVASHCLKIASMMQASTDIHGLKPRYLKEIS
jgi:tRNA threonylcarbamoyladenosine biosynthesis protein TsaB